MIPLHLKEAFDRYVDHGIEPGGFLMAVLENNLCQAVGRADDQNIQILKDIVAYVYNDMPSECWGSPEKVRAWRALFDTECIPPS